MKKQFLIAAAIATSLFAAPQISVDQEIFDFGTVPEGDGKLTHTYKITNTGDEPLKIQKVKPGCSCTVVKFDDHLEPGETSEITAALKISGRSGHQNKPITVISNAENAPLLRLSLKAFIMGPVNMDRRYGIFQYSTATKTIKDSISLISTKEDLAITGAFYKQRGTETPVEIPVTTELKNTGKDGESVNYKLLFTFSPEVTTSQAGTIFFKTNHPKKPQLEFRCMIETKQQ